MTVCYINMNMDYSTSTLYLDIHTNCALTASPHNTTAPSRTLRSQCNEETCTKTNCCKEESSRIKSTSHN